MALVTYVTLAFLAIAVTTLGTLVFYPYAPDPGFFALLSESYVVCAPLSVILLFGILYVWPFKVAKFAGVRLPNLGLVVRFFSTAFWRSANPIKLGVLSEQTNTLRILFQPKLMLGISIAASIFLAWTPYRQDLNPSGVLVGIDTPRYVDWIGQMLSKPPMEAVGYSFVIGLNGSRPLVLLFLYAASLSGSSPYSSMEVLPLVLAPALSLSSYMFVRYGMGDARLAGLTALLTTFSFYVTVGMWGGYVANSPITGVLAFFDRKTPGVLQKIDCFYGRICRTTHTFHWQVDIEAIKP